VHEQTASIYPHEQLQKERNTTPALPHDLASFKLYTERIELICDAFHTANRMPDKYGFELARTATCACDELGLIERFPPGTTRWDADRFREIYSGVSNLRGKLEDVYASVWGQVSNSSTTSAYIKPTGGALNDWIRSEMLRVLSKKQTHVPKIILTYGTIVAAGDVTGFEVALYMWDTQGAGNIAYDIPGAINGSVTNGGVVPLTPSIVLFRNVQTRSAGGVAGLKEVLRAKNAGLITSKPIISILDKYVVAGVTLSRNDLEASFG